jgi:DUF4097 and DUF4098 domain-containing protein YvlB
MILLLTTLVLLALRPAAAVERTFKRSFPVQAGAAVKVDIYRGAIVIEESNEDKVRVEVRLELATEDEKEADQSLGALKLKMEVASNEVSVVARNPSESRALFVWEEKQRIQMAFRVFVPRGSSVDLATLDGGVTVGNFTGKVVARTGAGTIFCRRIDGSIKAEVGTGDIVISRCTGAVDLHVQRGNIRAGTIFGHMDACNSSGYIDVLSAVGGLNAATAAGDVTVGFQKGFTGDAKVEVNGGSIFVKVDPTAAMSLDASTSWGHVQTVLPFAVETGGSGKSEFTGKLNGGGPAVHLHASGGHVELDAYKQFFDINEEN